MLLPFKLGLSGVFGSVEQYMSCVSIDDAVTMIQYVMTNDSLQGPVNFVTPNALNNRTFTKSLGQVLSRPQFFGYRHLPRTLHWVKWQMNCCFPVNVFTPQNIWEAATSSSTLS